TTIPVQWRLGARKVIVLLSAVQPRPEKVTVPVQMLRELRLTIDPSALSWSSMVIPSAFTVGQCPTRPRLTPPPQEETRTMRIAARFMPRSSLGGAQDTRNVHALTARGAPRPQLHSPPFSEEASPLVPECANVSGDSPLRHS